MPGLLRGIVILFGGVCCIIALSHIALGHGAIPGAAPGFNAIDDSEDRFYATLFLGFGAAMVWCGLDLGARRRCFGWLLVVFFLGGMARLFSVAAMGLPGPLFTALGVVELALPPLLWTWRSAAYR